MPCEGACLGLCRNREQVPWRTTCPIAPSAWCQTGKPPPRGPQRCRDTQNPVSCPWTIKALSPQTSPDFQFSTFYWDLLLERHFPVKPGSSKMVQQTVLKISQPRDDSQGSDETKVVRTSRVAAPLQPFTGCHLTRVIFSEASAVTVIFSVFRKC